MNAQELFRAGQLADALKALSAEVRDNPTDARRRTFLFELLCFAGEYERADKQLEVLGQAGPSSEIGVLLYRSALLRRATSGRTCLPAESIRSRPDSSAPGYGRHVQWQAVQLLFRTPIPGLDPGSKFLRQATTCGFPSNTSPRFKSSLPSG